MGRFPEWHKVWAATGRNDKPSLLGSREPSLRLMQQCPHDKAVQKLPNGAGCFVDYVGGDNRRHSLAVCLTPARYHRLFGFPLIMTARSARALGRSMALNVFDRPLRYVTSRQLSSCR